MPVAFSFLGFLKEDLLRKSYLANRDGFVKPEGFFLWRGLFSPKFFPILLQRLSYFFHISGLNFFSKVFSSLNLFLFGVEISTRCYVGPGFFLPHPLGVVIGAVSIGSNATIFQGVTLGAVELDIPYTNSLRPTIGDNVIIGAGAKVLGGIKVANFSVVGANAVLLKDTMKNGVYVGVPAKKTNEKNYDVAKG